MAEMTPSSLVDEIKSTMKDDLIILKDPGIWIPTGVPELDIQLNGGIPGGRLTTAIGAKSAGKTTLIVHILGNTQKMGGIGVLFDVERSAWKERSIKMGVDISKLIVAQPDTLDTYSLETPDGKKETRLGVFELTEKIIWAIRKKESEVPVTIVTDSIASSSVASEMDGDVGDASMGKHARIVSQGLRMIMGHVNDYDIALIFVNQMKEKIGVMYGSKKTYMAKNPIDFHSSITLELAQDSIFPNKEHPKGIVSRAYVSKNKVGNPFGTVKYNVFFEDGVDTLLETVECLAGRGMLGDKPGYVMWEEKARRKPELVQMAKDDPALANALFLMVDELIVSLTARKGYFYGKPVKKIDESPATEVHGPRTKISRTPVSAAA